MVLEPRAVLLVVLFIFILIGLRFFAKLVVALFVLWVCGDFKSKKIGKERKKNRRKVSDDRPFFVQGMTRRRKLSLGNKGNVLDGSVLDKWKGHAKKMFGGKK